ncbi:MAG: P-loop NTPase fold protein [Mariprofundaceae bacterium]|nr:P-loop NTPase fold protein [Mariprofundaceae bacterium]
MTNYQNDQPITGMSNEPDRLNRESFAQRVADILMLEPDDECLTISLEAEWGYGKTSVINLVEKSASNRGNKPIIVEYNPWLAGKADALIQDFLIQFSSQLDVAKNPKEGLRAAKEILAYSQLFNAMKFMPNVEPWASTLNSLSGVIGDASKKMAKLKDVDVFHRKSNVRSALNDLDQPIIVIIDDIDRLTPDEAFQVIRLVKVVADFPGVSFLLSFDPEYLAGALANYGIKKAEQYIDKVVQLRIPLPVIAPKDMQKLANIELASLSEDSLTDFFAEDQKRLSYVYHKHLKYLVRSPRELKRIFNHLRFVLSRIEGEVCFTDLYCLAVLAIKAQGIYKSLKEAPEMYVGRKFDEKMVFEKREEVIKRYRDTREAMLEKVDRRNQEHVRCIVYDLFPLVDSQFSAVYSEDYDRCGRVACEKRLYTALHYQVPLGFASDVDIISFINGETDREDYLQRAIDEDFVERLLELLQQNLNKIKASHVISLLNAVYEVFLDSEYLESFVGAVQGPFDFDPFRQIVWLSVGLVAKQDYKKDVLFKLIENPKSLAVSAELIKMLMIQNDAIATDDPSLKKEVWLYGKDYSDLVDQWCTLMVKHLQHHDLIHFYDVAAIYTVLVQASPKRVKKLFNSWSTSPEGLSCIATLIAHSGDDKEGAYAHIQADELSALMTFSRLKSFADSQLSQEDDLSPMLKAVYLSISTGKAYYLSDARLVMQQTIESVIEPMIEV